MNTHYVLHFSQGAKNKMKASKLADLASYSLLPGVHVQMYAFQISLMYHYHDFVTPTQVLIFF